MDKHYIFLRTCFPDFDSQTIKRVLRDCNQNADLASSQLQALSIQDAPSTLNELDKSLSSTEIFAAERDEMLATLISEFPEIEVEQLEMVLSVNANDLECSRKYLLQVTDDEPLTFAQLTSIYTPSQSELDVLNRRRPNSSSLSSNNSSSLQSSRERIIDVSSTLPPHLQTSAQTDFKDTGNAFREQASQHAQVRNELFSKASASYKRKQQYGPAIAGYYAEQGRLVAKQMEQANQMAAQSYLIANNGPSVLQHRQEDGRAELLNNYNNDGNGGYDCTLDLHNLHVKECMVAMKEQLSSFVRMGKRRCLVITGKSRDQRVASSNSGKGKLYAAVETYLLRNGYKFDYAIGSFLVKLT